jgi:hypothetical protein
MHFAIASPQAAGNCGSSSSSRLCDHTYSQVQHEAGITLLRLQNLMSLLRLLTAVIMLQRQSQRSCAARLLRRAAALLLLTCPYLWMHFSLLHMAG